MMARPFLTHNSQCDMFLLSWLIILCVYHMHGDSEWFLTLSPPAAPLRLSFIPSSCGWHSVRYQRDI